MTPARHLPAIVVVAAVAAVVLLAAASEHDACHTAQQAFGDCVPYVVGEEPAVSPRCCTGLADLREMGGTAAAQAQRRALCACILAEVRAAGEMDAGRAAGLAASCKVAVGFIPTRPDFNCSAVP